MNTTDKLKQLRASEKRNAQAIEAYRGASWKQQQIHSLKYRYGHLAEKWSAKTYGDDRDLYVNTYRIMMVGLKSLSAEPDLYVRVAMGQKMREDRALLDRIALRFGENTLGGIGGRI